MYRRPTERGSEQIEKKASKQHESVAGIERNKMRNEMIGLVKRREESFRLA